MTILFVVAFLILLTGIALLIFMERQKRSFGILQQKRVYQDTEERRGRILYAKTLNLMGRPDYIIHENGAYIPVEEKPKSKTPQQYPWRNHKMQLLAYCYLVEENYGIRPPYGVVRYLEKEFTVKYTEVERQSVIQIVQEITECHRSPKEFHCSHPKHNFQS